jgi:hypothetical protein
MKDDTLHHVIRWNVRTAHLCVPLVTHFASNFVGAAHSGTTARTVNVHDGRPVFLPC